MFSLIRVLFRVGIFVVVLLLLTQPFNWFCNMTNKCQPFYLSYYFPKAKGTQSVNINFEVSNYRNDFDLAPDLPTITTVAGEKNDVIYFAKNLSDENVKFSPRLIIEPAFLEKYVTRYNCLCNNDYNLKPREQLILHMRFAIDNDIEDDPAFKNIISNGDTPTIRIRYHIGVNNN